MKGELSRCWSVYDFALRLRTGSQGRTTTGSVQVHGLQISPGTWFTVSPIFGHLKEVLTCPGTKPQPWTNECISSPITSTWGAKKLLALLWRSQPHRPWPARTTVCDILKRHGLVPTPRTRRRPGPAGPPQTPLSAPNHVWTADFKGQFRTLDGRYCHPLTVVDGYSRFLLGCQALDAPQGQLSRPVFQRLFRTYGLPRIIRTDNGAPFASSQALGRLSQLSVWWIRLGIQPSPRPFPRKLPPLHYPAHWEVRRVSTNGGIRWKTHRVAVSNALRQQPIGLEPIDDGVWEVGFGPLRLGRMDERQLTITDALGKPLAGN